MSNDGQPAVAGDDQHAEPVTDDSTTDAAPDDPTTDAAPDDPTTDGPAEYDARDDLPDVKTDPDGQNIKRTAHPVEWEAVGREAIVDLLENQRDNIERDVGEVIATLDVGTPVDPVHVLHVRDAIEALEITVEERVVPVAPDRKPWERTVERIPDYRMRDALGLDAGDVRELNEQREEDESTEE